MEDCFGRRPVVFYFNPKQVNGSRRTEEALKLISRTKEQFSAFLTLFIAGSNFQDILSGILAIADGTGFFSCVIGSLNTDHKMNNRHKLSFQELCNQGFIQSGQQGIAIVHTRLNIRPLTGKTIIH